MSRMNAAFDRLLLDENPDAVIMTTPSGEVVCWNKGAETMYGFTEAEVLGRPLSEAITSPERIDEHLQLLDTAISNGFAGGEGIRRRKDGTAVCVDVSCKAVRNSSGALEYILFTQKDVTALKVLRDAKFIEAKFGGLLESMPDAIVMANSMGRIVRLSSSRTGRSMRRKVIGI